MAKEKKKTATTSGKNIATTEKEYLKRIRNRMLIENGLDRGEYISFIEKRLGGEYASKNVSAFCGPKRTEVESISGNRYIHGYELQKHMEESLRASTASVYTPEPVAAYLAERGIFYFYEGEFASRGVMTPDSGDFYAALGNILLEKKGEAIRTMDISAGAGLLLLKMLSVMEKALGIAGATQGEIEDILLNQTNKGFFANDLHKEGLELFLISLLNRFLGSFEISDIRPAIFSRDAVSDCGFDEPFDLILGNPPYLGEKGNRRIFEKAKESEFGIRRYEAKMDYFYFFIYKAVELLRPGGFISYVTTNYFMTADGGSKLREFLRDETCFRDIFILDGVEVFSEAKGQHNILFTIQKKPSSSAKALQKIANGASANLGDAIANTVAQEVDSFSVFDEDGNIVLYENVLHCEISKALRSNATCMLGDLCEVRQGLVSGCDRTSRRNIPDGAEGMEVNQPIYVFLSPAEVPEALRESTLLKPFYKNSDIGRYTIKDSERLILYVTDKTLDTGGEKERDAILEHLGKYREILSKRREVVKGSRKWYELQWYREERVFNGPKIMVPHRALENRFVYTEGQCYGSADIYYISGGGEKYMKALCCILNSSLAYFWLRNNGKRKGKQLELYHTPLKRIPIPALSDEDVRRLAELHDLQAGTRGKAEEYVCRLYGLNRMEMDEIEKFAQNAFQ